jgi:hypothetical protein
MPGSPEQSPLKFGNMILVGYVKEVLAGLIVTDEGMLRIVMDNDHGAGG